MGDWKRDRVLVPLDFSEAAFDALRVGADVVADRGGLHVVHVLPELSPMEPGALWNAVDDASRKEHARQALREQLPEDLRDVTIDVLIGSAAPSIAEHASTLGADLIILPSHGRTGATRWLIGSVAERVVRLAHCPVLVLRT